MASIIELHALGPTDHSGSGLDRRREVGPSRPLPRVGKLRNPEDQRTEEEEGGAGDHGREEWVGGRGSPFKVSCRRRPHPGTQGRSRRGTAAAWGLPGLGELQYFQPVDWTLDCFFLFVDKTAVNHGCGRQNFTPLCLRD